MPTFAWPFDIDTVSMAAMRLSWGVSLAYHAIKMLNVAVVWQKHAQ